MKNKPLKKLFNSTSFKARLARGSLWLSISGGTDVSLKLVRNMVLARLIAPDAFGVMARFRLVTEKHTSWALLLRGHVP